MKQAIIFYKFEMIVGMILAFWANEMSWHNDGATGIPLLVTAVACTVVAMFATHRNGSQQSRSR